VYHFLLVFFSNFVPEIFDFKNAVILKTGLEVRQGHCECHRWIVRLILPIDVLLSRGATPTYHYNNHLAL